MENYIKHLSEKYIIFCFFKRNMYSHKHTIHNFVVVHNTTFKRITI